MATERETPRFDIEKLIEGADFYGIVLSEGDAGLRIALERQILPVFIELIPNLDIIIVYYGGGVQAEYNFAGELLSGAIWLMRNWEYQKATQPMVWSTGSLEDTLTEMGFADVMVGIDLLNGFRTDLLGQRTSGEIVGLGDDAMPMFGNGSPDRPLVGRFGSTGVVAISWDENLLKLGVGENTHVRMMPVARRVETDRFLANLSKTTVSEFITKALPRIRLFSEEE